MPVEHNPSRNIAAHASDNDRMIAELSGRPLLPNTGIPLNLDWVREVRVNTSAVERRAQSQVARRTVKKEWQAAWLLRAITCMDLTTLSGDDTDERVRLQNIADRRPPEQRPALVSAITGEGIDALAADIEARLGAGGVLIELQIDPADGAGVSWLHRHTEVLHKAMDENSGRLAMTVRAAADRADAVRAKFARAGH